jgi:hypothetical protein
MVVCPIYAYRLMGINPITVSLVALFRVALLSFLKGSRISSDETSQTENYRLSGVMGLVPISLYPQRSGQLTFCDASYDHNIQSIA